MKTFPRGETRILGQVRSHAGALAREQELVKELEVLAAVGRHPVRRK